MSKYSQFNEEEVLKEIFDKIGTTDRFAVEIGCLPDYKFSNIKALVDEGWQGLFIDKEASGGVNAEFITAENINDIFQKYDLPQIFDLLSIDIDGNDFWVWKALIAAPRVVVIEYNRHKEGEAVNDYDPNWIWKNNNNFGASKDALVKLATEKGYTLFAENESNLFFIYGKTGK